MSPSLLSDLSHVFRLDAYALESSDASESERLHECADELAERAIEEGE